MALTIGTARRDPRPEPTQPRRISADGGELVGIPAERAGVREGGEIGVEVGVCLSRSRPDVSVSGSVLTRAAAARRDISVSWMKTTLTLTSASAGVTSVFAVQS
jgi:hypothetical protein